MNQQLEMKMWRRSYTIHKSNAKGKNVEFLFSFEDWFKVWLDSGHIHQRGRNKGQYQMARFGDKGPYASNNVKIISIEENEAELWERPETLQKIQKALIGNSYAKGYKHTEECKQKWKVTRPRLWYKHKPRLKLLCVDDGKVFNSISEAAKAYRIGEHRLYDYFYYNRKKLDGKIFRRVTQ